jgi:transmembrane sensor
MGNYSTYKVEDFLLDESFINWVLNNSEKDAIFWESWVAAHPTCTPTVKLAKKTLIALSIKQARQLTDDEIDSMITNLESRVQLNSNKPKRFSDFTIKPMFAYPIAAALIMGILIASYFNNVNAPVVSSTQSIAYSVKDQVNYTKAGMLIKLADGSSVVLTPGSRLSYPTVFKGETRAVTLVGEAFFEVQKDVKHPFFVTSGNLVTRVVGTSFSIKAYKGTKEYRVTVNTGKVLVSQKNNYSKQINTVSAIPIAVIPNQQIVYNIAQHSLVKENLVEPLMLSANVSKDLFTFSDTPLNKVISRIERAYNVSISYNEKEIGGCPLTASLADEHLIEKLDLISKALGVKYTINDGQIVLQGTGCNNH